MALLHGKVATVSGSTRGIGKAIARRLLEEGATVYITGRNGARLGEACGEFRGDFGDRARAFQGDLSGTGVIAGLLGKILEEEPRLDVVVANIGSGRSKPGWDVDEALWREAFEINLFPAVNLVREAVRVMAPRGGGSIVLVSSIAGRERIEAPAPYAAAKAALQMFMKYTSAQVAPLGIRVNAISPGNVFFPGGTWDRKMKEDSADVTRYLKEVVPMQRFASPAEIAELVAFLASERAGFITGADVVIDGGQTRGA